MLLSALLPSWKLALDAAKAPKTIISYLDSAKRLEAYLAAEGLPLESPGIRFMLRRRGEQAGVQDCHPHRFRHTFADSWLAAGGGPRGGRTRDHR